MYKINDLTFKYPKTDKVILDHISYGFHHGKTYAILGKSGAGKSTFISLLSGLETTSNIDLEYDGKKINNLEKERKELISVIFQAHNLIETYSVRDNLRIAAHLVDKSYEDELLIEKLESVDLDETYLKRNVLTLSGGEMQRIGIARAMLTDAPIIIADEPTGNLDEETQEKVFDLLEKLAHEHNKIVIIVTHSQMVANQCDEVLGLSKGKLNKLKAI